MAPRTFNPDVVTSQVVVNHTLQWGDTSRVRARTSCVCTPTVANYHLLTRFIALHMNDLMQEKQLKEAVATIHGLFDTALVALDVAYAAEKDPTIKSESPW